MKPTLIKAEEPNPFEQSFSSVSSKFNQYSPPTKSTESNGVDVWVSDTSSYSYDSNSVNNDTYSVPDQHITSSEDSSYSSSSSSSSNSDDIFQQQAVNPLTTAFAQQRPKRHSNNTTTNNSSYNQYQYQAQFINSNGNGKITRQSNKNTPKKRTRNAKLPEDEEKRKNFLERNRLAALKCRQRKKQWLTNLQARAEYLTNDNDQLQMQAEALRKEIMDLKTLLVAHKDCSNYQVYHQDFIMN